jgi:type I restriction enzyme S subunit
VTLGELSLLISKGTTPTSLGQKYSDDGIPFLRAEDVNGWEIEVDKIPLHISQETDEILSRSQLHPGDFVITIAGTLGRVGYIPHNASYINCNQAVAFARIDKLKVDVQFLCLICRVELVIGKLLELKMGGALQNLNLQQIRQFKIPLPPLPEQKRIAAILKEQLAAVDKARKAAGERLEAVKALPAAFLRKVFPRPGQPLPEGWRWVKLGEVTKVVNGTTPASENKLYWNGDIVWITPTDLGKLDRPEITNSERRISTAGFNTSNLTLVPPGTVVLSSRAPIGHLGIATLELCTNQGCKSFVPGYQIDTYFLYYSLKKSVPKLKEIGRGPTFDEISKSQCERFDIPIPILSEQKRIATILSEQMVSVVKALKAAEEELKTINALPAAILRKAFNGEL